MVVSAVSPKEQLFADLAFPFTTMTPSFQTSTLSRLQSQKGSFSVVDPSKAAGTNQRMKIAEPLSQFAKNQLPQDPV